MSEETNSRIRLVLLDAEALFRAGLSRVLASQPGLEVVGECGSSAEALEILRRAAADVVLLDLDHGTQGGGFMPAARRDGYQGRFLIVTGAADAMSSATALKLGASGIFLKSEPASRLAEAIRLVAEGEVWLDQRTAQSLAARSVGQRPDAQRSGNSLTDRQQRVLLGILGGLTNRQIGNNLGVSEGTVKASVQELFYCAGVRKRSQLVRVVLEGSLERAKELARRTNS